MSHLRFDLKVSEMGLDVKKILEVKLNMVHGIPMQEQENIYSGANFLHFFGPNSYSTAWDR